MIFTHLQAVVRVKNEWGFRPSLWTYRLNWARRTFWLVRWLRWHCPPDTGFEIWSLAVWGRACSLSFTEALQAEFHQLLLLLYALTSLTSRCQYLLLGNYYCIHFATINKAHLGICAPRLKAQPLFARHSLFIFKLPALLIVILILSLTKAINSWLLYFLWL